MVELTWGQPRLPSSCPTGAGSVPMRGQRPAPHPGDDANPSIQRIQWTNSTGGQRPGPLRSSGGQVFSSAAAPPASSRQCSRPSAAGLPRGRRGAARRLPRCDAALLFLANRSLAAHPSHPVVGGPRQQVRRARGRPSSRGNGPADGPGSPGSCCRPAAVWHVECGVVRCQSGDDLWVRGSRRQKPLSCVPLATNTRRLAHPRAAGRIVAASVSLASLLPHPPRISPIG